MWICPNCKAVNYDRGACECCGYDGKCLIDDYRITYGQNPLTTDETTRPVDILWGTSIC